MEATQGNSTNMPWKLPGAPGMRPVPAAQAPPRCTGGTPQVRAEGAVGTRLASAPPPARPWRTRAELW